MTLSTIAQPFASYTLGEGVTKGCRTSGQASGFLYRTEDGQVCVVSRTAVMAAPSFYYYPTLLEGWKAFVSGRPVPATPETRLPAAIPLTPAQQLLTLEALELRMSDLTERAEVLAAGEVCNLLRTSLGMEARTYWENMY